MTKQTTFGTRNFVVISLVLSSILMSCLLCDGFTVTRTRLSKPSSMTMMTAKKNSYSSSFRLVKRDNKRVTAGEKVETMQLTIAKSLTQQARTALTTAALLFSLGSLVTILPATAATPATTTIAENLPALVFTNDYTDPLHPLCGRHIDVGRDGTTFKYSGTALDRDLPSSAPFAFSDDAKTYGGCSRQEIQKYGIRTISGDGIISNNGKTIELEGMTGTWEEKETSLSDDAMESGILWNDGTKWTVKEKSLSTQAGEAFFYAYIGFSTLAGFKGVADKINERREASSTEN
mmetsp:Transcript_23579/g.33081  ORF Transcript_23579/g.33081 Transcript_23579/m.33081 type:complete len:291 (+) Transcript_23579:154-1026(+)